MHRGGDHPSRWKGFHSEGALSPVGLRGFFKSGSEPWRRCCHVRGATGISAHLARCLVPFTPRLVFLGRTLLDPGIHPAKPRPEQSSSEAFTFDPRASGDRSDPGGFALLRDRGNVPYLRCDRPRGAAAIMGEVASRYGKIDGIIQTAPESSGTVS